MIEDLLTDLAASGWTISWAYQWGPSHWRMSIIREEDVGEAQGTYLTHCVDAPSFAEALEDCMSKLAEAEFEPKATQNFTIEAPKASLADLISANLRPSPPIRRRV
jgi:hypothetical protein